MLLSPPLTADSCSPPTSLKRSFSDATDDAYTPPATPPEFKRRRCQSSVSSPAAQQDTQHVEACFDPSKLLTPPEYTHVPYDPDFGRKVCKQYQKSLLVQRAWDKVDIEARKQKYGEEVALAYSPGSTPNHIRRSYEDEQRRLDQAFAEIIANSESEAEPAGDSGACIRSGELGSKLVHDPRSKFMARNSNHMHTSSSISRDVASPQLKHIQPGGQQEQHHHERQQQSFISTSCANSTSSNFKHCNGVQFGGSRSSIDASCNARAQTAYKISSLRRKYRLREQHRSSLIVGN